MSDDGSGASGRRGLATYRDEDWTDLAAMVAYLPVLALREGTASAMAWAKTELRPTLALFAMAAPRSKEEATARAAVALFFTEGCLRLLCDNDGAGERFRTFFLEAVNVTYFEPGARSVFERSSEAGAAYVPAIPRE